MIDDNGINLEPDSPENKEKKEKKEKPDIEELAKSFGESEQKEQIEPEKTDIPSLDEPGIGEAKESESIPEKEENDVQEISLSEENLSLKPDVDEKTNESDDKDPEKIDLDDISFDLEESEIEDKANELPVENAGISDTIKDDPEHMGGDTNRKEPVIPDLDLSGGPETSQDVPGLDEKSPELEEVDLDNIVIPSTEELAPTEEIPVPPVEGGTPSKELANGEEALTPPLEEEPKEVLSKKEEVSVPSPERKDVPAEQLSDAEEASIPAEEETKKGVPVEKKSKAPMLLALLLIAAGGVYYFGVMEKKEPRVTVKRPPVKTEIEKVVKKQEVQIRNPYVYPGTGDVQKDTSEGIITYVYNTDAAIKAVYNYYKNKMNEMGYVLKSDDFKTDSEYAHIVFSKEKKDCSIIIRQQNGSVSTVVSYVE